VGSLTDITEAKRAAEDRERLELQLRQAQRMEAVGRLAGGVAHDFNNLLTAVVGNTELALQQLGPDHPVSDELSEVRRAADRAASLVAQLLAFTRQQIVKPTTLDLNAVVNDGVRMLRRLIGEDVELQLDLAVESLPIQADRTQLDQVLINLAVNARDAMTDGGKLTIRTANVSEAESRGLGHPELLPGEYVLIEVRDTGCGMTPEVMRKIFEPFFSTKEIGRGTGLGLSTVYGIVKQTGGYIFADSDAGNGTTMHVYLPRLVETAVEAEQPPIERRPEKPKDLTGRGTVLLVEDEDAVRSFAARALGQRGYNVLQATTGVEALEIFAGHQGEVDLVVSDVVMPEMDGPTLFEKLRRQRPDLKVIFISGYAEDAFRQHLAENEDFMFLQKPFDLKELAAAVKAALQG
jgi:two-component system cell cycle sensor histidine kinase/response regulator CckA